MIRSHRTLVVSDVHLCGLVPSGAAWMTYRQKESIPDAALALLFGEAVRASAGSSLEIVLNGDLFDFDAPDVPVAGEDFPPPNPTHQSRGAAVWLDAVLRDHPVFVQSVRHALASGARVVFVPGNHDAQIAFASVRKVLQDRLSTASTRERLVFRSWFHRTPDGMHIEHGHQYDPLCALRDMTAADVLENTVGSVASYYAPMLTGCPTPRAFDPFDLDLEAIAKGILAGVTAGPYLQWHVVIAVRMIRELGLACTRTLDTDAHAELGMRAAKETGVHPAALARHAALFMDREPIERFLAQRGWSRYGEDVVRRVRDVSMTLASLHGVRGVITGHTHRACGATTDGVFIGNSGTWERGDDSIEGQYIWTRSSSESPLRAWMRRWPQDRLSS